MFGANDGLSDGVSKATVQPIRLDNWLMPPRVKSFKVSNDPLFAAKWVNVVGLYLNPPENALVLPCDEKSQIQALDRTQKSLPPVPRPTERTDARLQTSWHDDVVCRHRTGEGQDHLAECLRQHRPQASIKFLKRIEAEIPADLDVKLILGNYGPTRRPRNAARRTACRCCSALRHSC